MGVGFKEGCMAGRVAALRSQEQPRPHAWRDELCMHGGATGGTARGVCMRIDSLLSRRKAVPVHYSINYLASFMFLVKPYI